jgi:hypothetical protein
MRPSNHKYQGVFVFLGATRQNPMGVRHVL